MPAKKKDEDILDTPGGEAVPGTEPVRQDWPESTENRELPVELTEEERLQFARDAFKAHDDVESLKVDKKHAAKNFDQRIKDEETRYDELSDVAKSGHIRRKVPCVWKFETNGVGPDGKEVYHSSMKTLFREDTGAVVEVVPISDGDRQMTMPLGDEESHAANVESLAGLGWFVTEAGNDDGHDENFTMFSNDPEDVSRFGIAADTISEAVVVAMARASEIAAVFAE